MKKGFTLIELAISMIILSIIIGSSISLFKVGFTKQNIIQNKQSLQTIKDSIYGYAAIHGKLPSSDTTGDGIGDGVATLGDIPYIDLQIDKKDRFGMVYKYDINETLLDSDISNICQRLNDISISSTALPKVEDNSSNSYSLASIVISKGIDKQLTGKNSDGRRVYEMGSNRYDELTNNDLVLEITANELYNRVCSSIVENNCTDTNTTECQECNMTNPTLPDITLHITENNGNDRSYQVSTSSTTCNTKKPQKNETFDLVLTKELEWIIFYANNNCDPSKGLVIQSFSSLHLIDEDDNYIIDVNYDTKNVVPNIVDN